MTNSVAVPEEDRLGFDQLLNCPRLIERLDQLGYKQPTEIQAQSIPVVLAGRDLLGQAQTGSGKTAAFALPILDKLISQAKEARENKQGKSHHQKGVNTLVFGTPLVSWPFKSVKLLKAIVRRLSVIFLILKFAAIYGGADYRSQIRQLQRGPQVVIGTPGRVMDHMRRGTLVLEDIQHIVLDEADEMLRMGFIEDVEWILSHTPDERQTLFVLCDFAQRN